MLPLAAAGIMAGGSILSGLIGKSSADAQLAEAKAAREQALQQWLQVNVPSIEEQQVQLQHFQQTGELSPELEQTFKQQGTSLDDIAIDPTYHQAELSALTKLQDISNNNGLDAQAKAEYQQAINKANANEQGQRGAIVQNFAQRGQAGSGAELQAQLLASQGDANQAASQGLDIAAQSQNRALQALMNSNSVANQMYNQDYQKQMDAAKAQDAINQFNTQNAQSVAARNAAAQNQAQQYNLNLQQDVANKNVGVANEQEKYNKGLYQQQFQNQAQKAAGASGQYGNQAQSSDAAANRAANMWSGIGQAVGQGVGAYGQYANNQAQIDAYNDRTKKMYG